jgi:hypothetical protein
MEWDRNRYFALGVILCCLGIQFRMVESFVLSEQTTRALHRFAKQSQIASNSGMTATELAMAYAPSPKKTVQPPPWLGWALLTAGGVISLHALALPKKS